MHISFPSKEWLISTYQQLREEGQPVRKAWAALKKPLKKRTSQNFLLGMRAKHGKILAGLPSKR
ncbi:MAG: hypothetical protein N2170_00550 [Bacteroidia bacterium]|nr:hypothetical protein [Bacteroidia bacterium]